MAESISSAPTVRIEAHGDAPPGAAGARAWRLALVVVGLACAGFGLGLGIQYYLTPLDQRPFSAMYQRFRPAGTFGLRYGIVGTSLIVAGVVLYTVRKRANWLARAGKLKYWLEFHIFLCSVGPFLVTLHTSFKVGGLVSIAFWSMVVVALSGVFGRYVYVRIPKTQGRFASLGEVEQEREALLASLGAELGPQLAHLQRVLGQVQRPQPRGFLRALGTAIRFDLTRRATLRRVRRALAAGAVPVAVRRRVQRVVERELQLEQQLALVAPFQRLFRYWHLLHLPLAIVMFLIVGVHVVVATMFGYGWTR